MENANSVQNTFSDLGIHDIEFGSELFSSLGLGQGDLMDMGKVSKLKEIVKVLQGVGEPSFYLSKVTLNNKNPHISQLDNLHRFAKLIISKKENLEKAEKLSEYMTGMDNFDEFSTLNNEKVRLENSFESFDNEIAEYLK